MSAPNPILTTIIFVFALQAMVLGVLLILKRPRKQAHVFLSFLIFFFALMAFNIAWVNVLSANNLMPVFRYFQMELLYGIGPSLYFYTKCITDSEFRFAKKDYIHFVPVVLEFLFYRTAFYRLGAEGMYQDPVHPYTKIYLWEQWLGILSITIYVVVSLILLFRYQSWLKSQFSNIENKSLNWMKLPVIIYAGYWIGWMVLTEIDRFAFDRSLRDSYFLPAFVGLAMVTNWIGFKGYLHSRAAISGFVPQKTRPKKSKSNSELAQRITELMNRERPYLDPELDLSGLADLLDINPKQLSQTINQDFAMNFYEFVNSYRVEAFKERLQQPESSKLTLLAHAFECGFNSKSTFNDVFKKMTGSTPSSYAKQLKN